MGVVYKARDTVLGRPVALKVMTSNLADNAEVRERFLREARSVSNLQHANIVVVHELGEHDGNPYIVMEYLDGEPLERTIRNRTPLTVLQKIDIILQVAKALQYAHEKGVVHRDVKPGNIMLLRDGSVKVVDFGIAHLADQTITRTGMVLGTVAYMSPEQLNGQPVDARTDIFSLGIVFYLLLAGKLPFEGGNTAETMMKILLEPPPRLAQFGDIHPPELQPVIDKALAKKKEERYQACSEISKDFSQFRRRLELATQSKQLERERNAIRTQLEKGKSIPSSSLPPVAPAVQEPLAKAAAALGTVVFEPQVDAPAVSATSFAQPIEEGAKEAPTHAHSSSPGASSDRTERLHLWLPWAGIFVVAVVLVLYAFLKRSDLSEGGKAITASPSMSAPIASSPPQPAVNPRTNATIKAPGKQPSMGTQKVKPAALATSSDGSSKRRASAAGAPVPSNAPSSQPIAPSVQEIVRQADASRDAKNYSAAAEWYRKAAERGNPYAQDSLSELYYRGWGVAKDYALAAQWDRKAADQGLARAEGRLGFLYQEGFGVEKDSSLAVQWYRKAAEQGEALRSNNLGIMYEKGLGVGKDLPLAVQWYRKAAEQGEALAETNLGLMYEKGVGLEKDLSLAGQWYRKAAEQGLYGAEYNLARMYFNGWGWARTILKPFQWYRKAADQNDPSAEQALGDMYFYGYGVNKTTLMRCTGIARLRSRATLRRRAVWGDVFGGSAWRRFFPTVDGFARLQTKDLAALMPNGFCCRLA